jgi:putative transposase
MKQKRHTPEEIIRLLREQDSSGLSKERFCREKQISPATLHRWRKKYGQMDVADAKRLKSPEKESSAAR